MGEGFLVLSFTSKYHSIFLVFFYCVVDILEILYHALSISMRRDPILTLFCIKHTPKTFDILTNVRSSYICVMEIVEFVTAVYFGVAIFIMKSFGQEWLQSIRNFD